MFSRIVIKALRAVRIFKFIWQWV